MYQKLTIVGHLGRDPEMRYTPSGQATVDGPAATDSSRKKPSGFASVCGANKPKAAINT